MDNNSSPETITAVVGKRVEHAREAANLSRNELAIAVGIPTTTFRNKELGFSEFTVAQLARIEMQLRLKPGSLSAKLSGLVAA
jgi:ribosome-binding protein aMBF1 (putative translation factor)